MYNLINKSFIWKIRLIRSHHAFQRVQMLYKYHKFAFVALLEPFQYYRNINIYKNILRMQEAK